MGQLRLRHRERIEAFPQQLNLTILGLQVPREQLMERSAGRGGASVSHILGERFFRRLDENTGVVRPEVEVRIKFQQLVNEPRDLTPASVARFDAERAQERQFERPVLRKKRRRCSGSRTEER